MKFPNRFAAALALPALLLTVTAVLPDDPKPAPGAKAAKAPAGATVKVERGPFKATVSLKGVFAASEMAEVVLRPEAWGSTGGGFVIVSAVEPGTAVKKGDVLVTLQTDKIDRAIRELEAEQQVGQVALRLAEEELPVLEKSTPLEMASAERLKKQADEDLKKFLETDRPLAEAVANNMVRNSEFFLLYAKEELKQLQKMYRNKDLTEETEEIILKRQRHQVEMSEFSLKTATIKRDQTLKIDLPRQEQSARDNAVKQTLALEKARSALPLTLSQKRLALAKLKYEHDKGAERLANLKKDRELMPVRSPADGIVYHGKCVNGVWNSATVTPKLQRGGSLSADEVFMTVVTARPMVVDANVDEKDLHWLKSGARGTAVPAGFPDLRLPVELAHLSAVPQSAGSFAAVFKVDAAKVPAAVVPGMACAVKVVAYRNDGALTLPSSAVFCDDDEEHHVYRPGGDKVPVQVGKTSGDRTEILGGIKEGDEVLASRP
jgi:multidrug efflux pump subunit AcrA (membrane-fusion protein)